MTLIYVPTDAEINAMQFAPLTDVNGNIQNAAAQRQGLRNFIANDKYLSDRRGQFTEKYAGENPWIGQVDFRILQDFILNPGKKPSTLAIKPRFCEYRELTEQQLGRYKICNNIGLFSTAECEL